MLSVPFCSRAVPWDFLPPIAAKGPVSLPGLPADWATYWATSVTAAPVTRSAGMRVSALWVCGSSCALRGGYLIWCSTMPANVLWPKPSRRARSNAASRLGPVTPVVPARASVWQLPHLETNRVLPFVTSAVVPVSEQALISAGATTQAARATERVRIGGASYLPPGPDRAAGRTEVSRLAGRPSRLGQAVQVPAGGRDHGARHAVPRVALARGRDHRRPGAGAQARVGAQPAGERGGKLRDGVRAEVERQPRPRGRRDRPGQRPRHLAQARVVGHDRQRGAGGGLGRDHAERLRERARD